VGRHRNDSDQYVTAGMKADPTDWTDHSLFLTRRGETGPAGAIVTHE
jgi:hypothetical protein